MTRIVSEELVSKVKNASESKWQEAFEELVSTYEAYISARAKAAGKPNKKLNKDQRERLEKSVKIHLEAAG